MKCFEFDRKKLEAPPRPIQPNYAPWPKLTPNAISRPPEPVSLLLRAKESAATYLPNQNNQLPIRNERDKIILTDVCDC